MLNAMSAMIVAGLTLLVTHLGLSVSGLRDRIAGAIGEGAYLGLYSVIALVAFANIIWAYLSVPRLEYFWFPNPDLYWLPKLLMPLATMLMVGGFMVRNPTAVGQGGVLDSEEGAQSAATGVNRITRHPFQWAVILWAATHLAANGDQVSVVFFGSFLLLSFLGSLSMDAKKRRQLGESFEAYTQITSNLPFAAILTGRNKLVLGELLWPAIAGVVIYVAMYAGHRWLGGVGLV